ncbi:MAG: hypothetical protein ACKO4W_15375, partial [Bacteroidota bacterium]
MKALAPLFALVFLFSHDVTAQTNDQQSRKDKIKSGRLELKNAVSADDPAAAGLWIDSLSRLENRYFSVPVAPILFCLFWTADRLSGQLH